MATLDRAERLRRLSPEQREALLAKLREQAGEQARAEAIPRRDAGAWAPLSFAQERLWVLAALDPESPAYTLAIGLELSGDLRVDALRAALSGVVARHEILRTAIVPGSEGPRQRPVDVAAIRMPMVDLGRLDGAGSSPAAELARLAAVRGAESFDLPSGRVLRATLARLGADRHAAMVHLHHLATDGWSNGILVGEIARLYAERVAGVAAALPELPIQYADFAAWQRRTSTEEALAPLLAAWRRRLLGAPAVLRIPSDLPRPLARSRRAGVCRERLPQAAVGAVGELAAAAGTTPFVVHLAAFQALLGRLAGVQDLVVGTPLAGRDRAELEPLVGFFVQSVALRADLSGAPSFAELVARTGRATLEDLERAALPFERLVAEIAPDRDAASTPIFQAVLAFQSLPRTDFSLPGLAVAPLALHSGAAKFDLTLYAEDRDRGERELWLEFDRDLFDPPSARRLLGHYRALLESGVAQAHLPIGALPILSAAERHQLFVEWGSAEGAEAALDLTVPALVERAAGRDPDAPALVWDGGELSYGELVARSRRCARALRARGVAPGEVVALALDRSPELIVAMLAVLAAGGAFLPLDPAAPAVRRAGMLADAQVRRLIAAEAVLELPSGLEVIAWSALDRQAAALDGDPLPPLAPVLTPDSLAYVLFTSGSTGRPKGVAVSHRAIARLVVGPNFAHLGPEETLLQLAPAAFDASTLEIWGALANGARLAIAPPGALSLGEIDELLARWRVTTLWLTAGLFHQMVERMVEWGIERKVERSAGSAGNGLAGAFGLRQLIAGGDALSVPHVVFALAALASSGGRVVNGYGPTENTTFTLCHDARRSLGAGGRWDSVPVGRPISGTAVRVLDADLRPLPIGGLGELFAAGRGLAQGYAGRPDLTAERFVPDPFGAPGDRLYATGDRVRFRGDGEIEFFGRADGQVKVRGFRIELGEIEAALAEHPAVASAVVVAMAGASGDAADRSLVAYVVPAGGEGAGSEGADGAGRLAASLVERLTDHLAAHLPAYMIPSRFVALAALPLTANGKVDRRALPMPEVPLDEDVPPLTFAPRSPDEELLGQLWADLVGAPPSTADEDFFGAGGHSLLATRLLARVEEAFAVRVPLGRFFERPTIAALAGEIGALRGDAAFGSLERDGARLSGPLRPLSFAQERLWLLDRFEPGNPAYDISSALALAGDLDVGALAAAVEQLADRHESLRTTFELIGGEPRARIAERGRLTLPLIDLAGLAPARRTRELDRIARAESVFPFALATGPLLRLLLVRLAEREHALSMATHHIVSDGWSLGVLTRDLTRLYGAFAARRGGSAPPLEIPPLEIPPLEIPPLEIQYSDFAAWQRAELAGPVRERLLGFWRGELAGAPPMLELPTDRPRPAIRTFSGGKVETWLPPAAAERVRALARRAGATPFMVLLAAFDVLCARLSGQDDVVVGTPISGRKRRATEDLIGIFLNTLVLRVDLAGDPTFAELLARVRRTALAAYAHQDLPFEHLIDELKPERDLSRTPLFQVYFNMLTYPSETLAVPGLAIAPLSPPEVPAKFDLTAYLAERDGTLRIEFVYNADLFSAARAAAMLDQYTALLAAVVERPDEPISRPSLVTDAARALLPDPRAPLSDAWEGAVHERFDAQVESAPDRLAVIDKDEAWSYRELALRANRLAHRLIADGVVRGDVVAILGHRSARLVWAVLGVIKAGAAFVVLDPAHPASRLVDCVRLARPRGFVDLAAAGPLAPALAAALDELAVPSRIVLPRPPEEPDLSAGAEEPAGWDAAPAVAIGPDDLAYVAFTSGSTGAPKGILGRHGPLSHFLPWQVRTFGFGPEDRYTMLSGLSHDPLQRDLFTPLQTGGAICAPDPEEIPVPGRLARWMQRMRVSIAHLTPAMGQVILERAPGDERIELPDLRFAFFVGDVLTRRDVRRLAELAPCATAINYYGSTETQRSVGFHVTVPGQRDDALAARESLPLGRGIEDVQLLVVGRGGQLAGIGEVGEILVRGPHLAAGYLGDPAGTAVKFVDNPLSGVAGDRVYRTGDLGRYRPDGEVEFAGRADVQIKIRGFRIEPGEIEAQLGRHPAVREAVVVARPDAAGDKRLVGYVVLDGGGAAATVAGELRAFLRERLPDYMVPAAFVTLPKLPVNPNGKVDRKALPEPVEPARAAGYAAPESEIERTLASVLREVLGIEKVSRDDNFFELGGNSLQLVRVQARLREIFDGDLAVVELFTHPTVASLAAHLLAKRSPGDVERPAPVEDRTRDLQVGRDRLRQRAQRRQQSGPSSSH